MKNENGKLYYGIGLDNDQLRSDAKQSRNIIKGIGDSTVAESSRIDTAYKQAVKGIALIGGGLTVGYLAKELYSLAKAFKKSMKEVSTISKIVTNDFERFKNSIYELTTKVPIGADAAAKALYQIVSAGHDGAKGMQVLEVAAKAAIGGVTETVTAADAITTVLNAYKKDASEANGISDQLFTTVRLGKTTFGELGQSISQAVPIAASFGIESEQVLAAVATLTKSGVPTAQAMTQIRASINAASKALGDGYFQTHTFQEGLNEIAERAGGSESKLRALVPEIEAINGVLGLTGINAKTAAADLKELGNSEGATQQAFEKMNNEADAQMTILKNTIIKKFSDIGQGAVDMVGSFAKLLNEDGVFSDSMINDVIASLVVLIATVGTYKTTIIATNAIQRVGLSVQYQSEMASLLKLLPVKQAEANTDIMQALAKGKLSQATADRLIAIRAEIAAELNALKVKAQALAAEQVTATVEYKASLQRSILAKQNMALAQSQVKIAIQSGNAKKIEAAIEAAKTTKIELNSAAISKNTTQKALSTIQSKSSAATTAVETMTKVVNTTTTNANTAAQTTSITVTNILSAAKAKLILITSNLNATIMKNPWAAAAVAAVALGYAIYKLVTYQTEAEKAQERLNNATLEYEKSARTEISVLNIMVERLKKAEKGTEEYATAKKAIQDKFGGYLQNMADEIKSLKDLEKAQIALTEAIIKTQRAKARDKFIETESENSISRQQDAIKKIRDRIIKEKGDKEGDVITSEIVSLLRGYDKEGGDYNSLYSKILTVLNSNNLSAKEIGGHALTNQIYEYSKAATDLRKSVKEAEVLFTEDEIKKDDIKTTGFDKKISFSYGEEYRLAKKEWENAKKELQLIEKDKNRFTKEQYENAKSREESAKNSFSLLGGDASNNKVEKDEKNVLKAFNDFKINAEKDFTSEMLALKRASIDDRIKLIEFDRDITLSAIEEERLAYVELAIAAKKGTKEEDIDTSVFGERKNIVNQSADLDIAKENKVIFKELLDELATYEQQRLNVTEEYALKRKAIQNEDGSLKDGFNEENLKILEKKEKEALKNISDEEFSKLSKNATAFASLFANAADMSKRRLKEVMKDLKQVVDYIDGKSKTLPEGISDKLVSEIKDKPTEIKTIYDQLYSLQEEYDSKTSYPFSGFVKGFTALVKSAKTSKEALKEPSEELKKIKLNQADVERQKGVQQIAEGAVLATDVLLKVTDAMKKLAEASGDEQLGEYADMVGALAQNFSAAAQGAASGGGWIGAIVGGAMDMISQTIEAIVGAKMEIIELENNTRDFQNAIKLMSYKVNDDDFDTIFGTSSIGKARDAWKKGRKALMDYEEILSTKTVPKIKTEMKSLGVAIFGFGGANFVGLGKTITNESKTALEAYEKGYSDLEALGVKTKDYSGWANFWGKKDEFTSLKDLAPDLWDKETNEFNIEAAKAFLETNTQISEEQRKQIQNVIDLKESYDESIRIIEEDLKSTFGFLGDEIVNSITNSIKTGADAWEDFRKAGAKAFEDLGKKMMYEIFFAQKFAKLQEDLKETYSGESAEDIGKKQAEILENFFDTIGNDMEGAKIFLENWKKEAKEKGFDVFEEDGQQADRKGFQTMSQDTGNELNGRFTAIQICAASIDINVGFIRKNNEDILFLARSVANYLNILVGISENQLLELRIISANTSALKETNKRLREIEMNTSRL